MPDTGIANFTNGVTAVATDRIAAIRSPFGAGDDRYLTPAYIKDYILGLANTWTAQNTFAAGTITTSQPLTITQTWNAGGVTFNPLLVNITDTASASASLLIDLQVGGSSRFNITKAGLINVQNSGIHFDSSASRFFGKGITNGNHALLFGIDQDSGTAALMQGGVFIAPSVGGLSWADAANMQGTIDTSIFRDAADTVAQRRGTNAQASRVYNTFTDASNYERLEIGSNVGGLGANTFGLAATAAGTGTVRSFYVMSNERVVADADGGAIAATDTNTLYTNEGATAEANFTLPTAAAGLTIKAYCQDADGIKLTAAAGDTIRIEGVVSAVAGNIASTTVGSFVKIVAINATEWVAMSVGGVWAIT